MIEVWKKFDKNYMVSNKGKIKSKNKILKGSKHDNGYLYVTLNKKQYTIHRLVAKLFLINEQNKKYINHIDGDKTNNCVDNLEWCTASENMIHAFKNNLVNTKSDKKLKSCYINVKKATEKSKKKVKVFDKNGNYITTFNSITEASIKMNANASRITQCCRHRQKLCGGYRWEYANER